MMFFSGGKFMLWNPNIFFGSNLVLTMYTAFFLVALIKDGLDFKILRAIALVKFITSSSCIE